MKVYAFTTAVSMANKLGRVVNYSEGLLTTKPYNTLSDDLEGHATKKNYYISFNRMPIAAKLGNMVA